MKTVNPNSTMEEQQTGQEPTVDPQTEQEVQSYVMGLSKILHGQKTQPQVISMLKSGGEPEKLIPQVALMINDQMEQAVKGKGKKPSLEVLVAASQFLVGDLIEMGNAVGTFQIESEEQVAPILKNTMQMYIEKGLKDGSLDPIELQKKVEPLMTEEHKSLGIEATKRSGLPEAPGQLTAMEAYARQRMQKQQQGMPRGGR